MWKILLATALGVGGFVSIRTGTRYDGPPIYVMGPVPGETRQTCVEGCKRHKGVFHCCPGKMTEACCERWASSQDGTKPECAGGDGGVPSV